MVAGCILMSCHKTGADYQPAIQKTAVRKLCLSISWSYFVCMFVTLKCFYLIKILDKHNTSKKNAVIFYLILKYGCFPVSWFRGLTGRRAKLSTACSSCEWTFSMDNLTSSLNPKTCIWDIVELANHNITFMTMKTVDLTCELSKPSQKVKQEQ